MYTQDTTVFLAKPFVSKFTKYILLITETLIPV